MIKYAFLVLIFVVPSTGWSQVVYPNGQTCQTVNGEWGCTTPSTANNPNAVIYTPQAGATQQVNSDESVTTTSPYGSVTTSLPYNPAAPTNEDGSTSTNFGSSAVSNSTGNSGTSIIGPASATGNNNTVQQSLLSPLCATAYTQTLAECASPGGTGSKIAQGINQGATVINIAQSQSPAQVNSACKSAQDAAIANGLGNGVIGYACYSAHSNCTSTCNQNQYDAAALASCQNVYHQFEVMSAAQGLTTLAQIALAGNCGSQTNPATPVIPGSPGYQGPQSQEPMNNGLQPCGGNGQPCTAAITPQSSPSDAGSAGSGLPGGAAYPGGAAGPAQAKTDNGLTAPGLGLTSSSGGGGWPTGTAGGNPAAPIAPFDLSALLPGQPGDPSRGPASISEITGANDLSNFHKVTRMINKKRPVLKSGEGA
jgi:hypothetical protein